MKNNAAKQSHKRPGDGLFYGFTCMSRQNYVADYIKASASLKGYTDEIMFGVQSKNGGTESEAAVRWIVLDKQAVPHFEAFTDGLGIMNHVLNSPGLQKLVKENPDFTPDDFSRMLINQGFIDMSDNKLVR